MWEFLSKNELGNLFNKLIDKNLTGKEQVEKFEQIWTYPCDRNIPLFVKMVLNGYYEPKMIRELTVEKVSDLSWLEASERNFLVTSLKLRVSS